MLPLYLAKSGTSDITNLVVVQLATDNSESVVDRVLVDVYLGESLRRAARHPPSVALVVDHHRRTCGNYRLLAVVKTPQAQSSEVKGKGFPYSIPSVGPGADPGVQAVSLQVTVSHPPGGRLPLLSARPVVTSPASEHHRPLAGTKLYCLVTEAHRCKQLAQGCYTASSRAGFELATC